MLIQSQNKIDTYKFWGNIRSRETEEKYQIEIHTRETGWVCVGEYTNKAQVKGICNEIVQSYINEDKEKQRKDIYYCPADIA